MYILMVEDVIKSDRIIAMIQPVPGDDEAREPDLFRIGCAGKITRFAETGDGRRNGKSGDPGPDR